MTIIKNVVVMLRSIKSPVIQKITGTPATAVKYINLKKGYAVKAGEFHINTGVS